MKPIKFPKITSLSSASTLSLLAVVILLGAIFFTVNNALQAPTNSSSNASVAGITSGHTYKIESLCNTTLFFDVSNNSVLNSAPIILWAWTSGGWNKDREWIVKDLGNGYYSIQALSSLKYLNVKGDSLAAGAAIIQYANSTSPNINEQWKIVKLENGAYEIVGKHSGMAIAPSACPITQGAPLYQYKYDGSRRMQWEFDDLTTPVPTAKPTPRPTVGPTCIPRPACLDAVPRCLPAEPIGGWCPTNPTPTCTPRPVCRPGFCTLPVPPPGGWCTTVPTPTEIPTPTPTSTLCVQPTPPVCPPGGTLVAVSPTPPLCAQYTCVTPTTSPAPGSTTLSLTVALHGIGSGGDSANPNSQGNNNPMHPMRSVTVDVYDVQNQLVVSENGKVKFDQNSGKFTGLINLGQSFSTGLYTVKVKADQYLRAIVPGIQTITSGQTTTLPVVTLVTGDINGDNTINIIDYNMLIGCYSDLLPPTNCPAGQEEVSDLTDDGHVNQFDYNLFLRELTNIGGQ